jgi:hypothetical protein
MGYLFKEKAYKEAFVTDRELFRTSLHAFFKTEYPSRKLVQLFLVLSLSTLIEARKGKH